jgi:iron complex transport system substrate-binding protein
VRIISLLPSLTEILAVLHLEAETVGVTHECDYPDSAKTKPRLTSSSINANASSASIETQVNARFEKADGLYALDTETFKALKPDLVLTQKLCDVCAVSYPLVERVVATLNPRPQLLSVEPTSLEEMYESIQAIAQAAGHPERAIEVIAHLRQRVAQVVEKVRTLPPVKVALLEWIEPLYSAGQWNPELVSLAGGIPMDITSAPSHRMSWDMLVDFDPEVILVMPCGFSLERTIQEMPILAAHPAWYKLKAVQNKQVYAADGNSYFNRPGPRLVDSLEIVAEVVHPENFRGLAPKNSFVHYC